MANRQPNIVRWKYANLNHSGAVQVMAVIGTLPLIDILAFENQPTNGCASQPPL
jgi:hypothetical protein